MTPVPYIPTITVRAPTTPPIPAPNMGEPTAFADRIRSWYEDRLENEMARADEPCADPQSDAPANVTEVQRRVNDVIDDIAAKRIEPHGTDATRLRGALDKAEAPLTGRAGADAGLGNAIGRSNGRHPFAFNW